MNERLEELLDSVQRTSSEVGDVAADAVYGVGKKAGALLSVAKLNIKIIELEGQINTALRKVGEMIYATHTGTPTDSEELLEKLQEIDSCHEKIAAYRQEADQLQKEEVCPICGAPRREGDTFCRECGGKF